VVYQVEKVHSGIVKAHQLAVSGPAMYKVGVQRFDGVKMALGLALQHAINGLGFSPGARGGKAFSNI